MVAALTFLLVNTNGDVIMSKELAKLYDPKDFEDRIYKYWNDSGCFKATVDKKKKPYTIVIPIV